MRVASSTVEYLKRKIVIEYYQKNFIRFEDTVLASGLVSPTYIDNRKIMSHPDLCINVTHLINAYIKKLGLEFDFICGVPMGALPIQFSISILFHYPVIMLRNERKQYATNNLIEGDYKGGEEVLIIEDVITMGTSTLTAIEKLETQGFKVRHVLALFNGEQGAKERLQKRGYFLHEVFTYAEFLHILESNVELTGGEYEAILTRYSWGSVNDIGMK